MILFIGVGGSGALLIFTSIVSELFLRRGERPPPPSPADLLQCNHDVRQLLDDLGTTAALVVTGPSDSAAGGTRWEDFQRKWEQEWDAVNDRCHFDGLADTGQGPAYDRMAWVWRTLATTKLKYRELMTRFSHDLENEIVEMRKALDRSLADLQRRTAQ
jgi:hypothetical protein